ncbi:MAG: cold shock domain-containing protein [Actinomycetota bacterium]
MQWSIYWAEFKGLLRRIWVDFRGNFSTLLNPRKRKVSAQEKTHGSRKHINVDRKKPEKDSEATVSDSTKHINVDRKKPEKDSEATVSDKTRLVELVGDKEKGKLTTLKKNFGFIERKSGVEIFFHFSNVVNEDLKELQRGQFVEYIVAAGKKGDEAREISLIREFSEDERFIENAPASNPRNSLNKSPKFTRPKKRVWEPSPFSQHDWHHGPEKR